MLKDFEVFKKKEKGISNNFLLISNSIMNNAMEISFQNERRFSYYSYISKEEKERERIYRERREGEKQGVLINFHSRVVDNTNEASNEKCK